MLSQVFKVSWGTYYLSRMLPKSAHFRIFYCHSVVRVTWLFAFGKNPVTIANAKFTIVRDIETHSYLATVFCPHRLQFLPHLPAVRSAHSLEDLAPETTRRGTGVHYWQPVTTHSDNTTCDLIVVPLIAGQLAPLDASTSDKLSTLYTFTLQCNYVR